MGYGMCTNIHSKIKSSDELYICDINQAQLDRFLAETKGQAKVEILKTPKDIAEQCVSLLPAYIRPSLRLLITHE